MNWRLPLARLLILAVITFAPLLAAFDWFIILVKERKATPYWRRLALYWLTTAQRSWNLESA